MSLHYARLDATGPVLELSVFALAVAGAWLVHARRTPPRWLAVVAVALVGLVLAAGLTALLGVPRPQIHDEWSYLFAADTFASGRVTNPTPPAWQAFESFHVLVRPSYMSKYPPAQALALAVGQRLTGLPIVGVWLSAALLGATLCWCLIAFVGPSWAFALGAVYLARLFTLDHLSIGYWAHSYWGGAVAASGGALVFGAAHRLARLPRGRDAALLVLGLGLLANSRPFEGLFMAAPVVVILLMTLGRRRSSGQGIDAKDLVPAGALAVVIVAWMAYYNLRVTGHALTLPYWEHESQYAAAPPMMFLDRRFPDYHVAPMAEYYAGEWSLWQTHKTLYGFRDLMVDKAQTTWVFYLGPLWTLVLLALPRVAGDGSLRIALLAIGSTLVAYATLNPVQAHYIAPLTAPLVVLLARCARWWAERFGAERLVAIIAIVTVVSATTNVVTARTAPQDAESIGQDRTDIETRLGAMGGKHLVLVRYITGHPPWNEWIYNRADLQAAPIVFARDDNLALSRVLIGAFRDRTPWQFDEATKELRQYVLPRPLTLSAATP